MEKTKIIDKSGDKKYFTQIPNMIVNHSTAYEQSLYLIMKRLAGEGGSCYASLNFLSSKMGVHKTTVSKTITELLKRKWIEEIENKTVKGGKVRQFVVVDIWPRNIKEYESGAEMTTKQGGASVDGSGAVVDGSGAQTDTKKSYKEEHIKEELLATTKVVAERKDQVIFDLIELFKPINPTYDRLFANKSQRQALERLVKKFGREKVESMIKFLPKIFGKRYAPRISTPYLLEQKLADLLAYLASQRSEGSKVAKIN
jgi:hemerythrin superfamily protein